LCNNLKFIVPFQVGCSNCLIVLGLQQIGKYQHYELGQWLRERYSEFLPEAYSREDIYIRSTDVDRTLMSAASNLAGLYPPEGGQIWNTNIKWQPIPIHTVPENMDEVIT
jgi:lysosomal acid phosphatase